MSNPSRACTLSHGAPGSALDGSCGDLDIRQVHRWRPASGPAVRPVPPSPTRCCPSPVAPALAEASIGSAEAALGGEGSLRWQSVQRWGYPPCRWRTRPPPHTPETRQGTHRGRGSSSARLFPDPHPVASPGHGAGASVFTGDLLHPDRAQHPGNVRAGKVRHGKVRGWRWWTQPGGPGPSGVEDKTVSAQGGSRLVPAAPRRWRPAQPPPQGRAGRGSAAVQSSASTGVQGR